MSPWQEIMFMVSFVFAFWIMNMSVLCVNSKMPQIIERSSACWVFTSIQQQHASSDFKQPMTKSCLWRVTFFSQWSDFVVNQIIWKHCSLSKVLRIDSTKHKQCSMRNLSAAVSISTKVFVVLINFFSCPVVLFLYTSRLFNPINDHVKI